MNARLALAVAITLGVNACGGGDGTSPVVPTTLTISPSGGTLVAITATLQLGATVTDQHGHTIASPAVTWSSSALDVVTVSATGLVTAVANGTAQVRGEDGSATAQVTVTVAQRPAALIKVAGDLQSDTTGRTLGDPLVVEVDDAKGYPVAGVPVTFATTSGSVNPTSAVTAANGRAQVHWTLGSFAGPQSASASAGGVTGSPAIFTGTAIRSPNAPTISGLAPDTLIEGQAVTITGTKFGATPNDNVVSIDGVQAVVTAASTTSLTVTVPTYDCRPTRLGDVIVTVAGLTDGRPGVPVRPGAFVTLATGEETIVQDPSRFCLQFRATGAETFLIGMSAPVESPDVVMPFQIVATGGSAATPAPAPVASRFGNRSVATLSSRSPEVGARLEAMRAHARAEATIRQWEALNLPRLRAEASRAPRAAPSLSPSAAPAVGDTVIVRYPQSNNPCNSYTTIKTVVRVVGSAGIWLYDVQNPTADSLTLADIQKASNQFDASIYATDTLHFGHPADIDNNGRVFVTLTWQINKEAAGFLGFVFAGDLFPGPSCPQSNSGEMYYGEVPDSLNVAGTHARPKSGVVSEMPLLIAHEFTHVIQFSQRLILNNGQMLASWEAEGQATLAEELAGDAVLGNTSYQNYDHRVAFGKDKGFDWYADEMLKWAEYFGLRGSNNQAPNAPELCTVYGEPPTIPCYPEAFYGASWIFQRYIGDQFGPSYPGGLTALTRDWVMKNPSLRGTANIAALLGVDYDTLFARFATALALDDKNNGTGSGWVPSQFSITSWNSDSISTWLATCCHYGWLTVPRIGFQTINLARSVRGGSTAYTLVSTSGAHPAAALKFRNPSGAILGTTIRPTLWVVRVN